MPERRTAAKLIRFHPEELARITEHARACRLTSARFIREAALGIVPKAARHAATDPLLRELARIGRSLDHITRAIQAGADRQENPALGAQLTTALAAHAEALRRVVADRSYRRSATPEIAL